MFGKGLLTAVVVTAAWILLQLIVMLFRPARNRFYAMLTGYLASLPLVYLVYRWLPLPEDAVTGTAAHYGLGLFHAYFLHLMLFLLYVEMFYHVERSVTLRFLVTLLEAPDRSARLREVQQEYSLDDMIRRRLADLHQNGFIRDQAGRWHTRGKGTLVALVMSLSSWLFRSKTQSERV